VKAEVSYLTWARVKEGKLLIPVVLGEAPFIPPLLRSLICYRIENVNGIADPLHNRWTSMACAIPPCRQPICRRRSWRRSRRSCVGRATATRARNQRPSSAIVGHAVGAHGLSGGTTRRRSCRPCRWSIKPGSTACAENPDGSTAQPDLEQLNIELPRGIGQDRL
jgi:hypothetical protein